MEVVVIDIITAVAAVIVKSGGIMETKEAVDMKEEAADLMTQNTVIEVAKDPLGHPRGDQAAKTEEEETVVELKKKDHRIIDEIRQQQLYKKTQIMHILLITIKAIMIPSMICLQVPRQI